MLYLLGEWRWSESQRSSYDTPRGNACGENIVMKHCVLKHKQITVKRDHNIIRWKEEKIKLIVKVILWNTIRQCMWKIVSSKTSWTIILSESEEDLKYAHPKIFIPRVYLLIISTITQKEKCWYAYILKDT